MNKYYKIIGLVILLIVVAILMLASGASAGAATVASTVFTTFSYLLGLALVAIGGAIAARLKKK